MPSTPWRFEPLAAESFAVGKGPFRARGLNGLYVQCTIGFYLGALENAGARDTLVHFERPEPDGAREGVPVERVRFVVQWRGGA